LINAPVFTKYYDALNWILDKVEKFPKSQRFVFGHRLSNLSLDILEGIIRAYYSKDKALLLKEINIRLEILRIFLRLVKDRQFISIRQYEFITKEINEVGKMIGGWIKERNRNEAD
jgi:hypothetical protein